VSDRARRALVPAGLFVVAALISGFTIRRGIDPFDEGLALASARRVSEGQMPYADFLWSYGPGVPYLLAWLRELLGASLIDWRVIRVLVDAGVATTVFAVVRRETGSVPLALAGWLMAACAMADPRSANPAAFALLPALLAVAVATRGGAPTTRRAVGAGALVALAAAFRLDFGLFAGVACVLAFGLARPGGRRALLAFAGTAVALTLAVYAPFLVAIGPADLYDALIGTSLRESDYWTLPFPLRFHGSVGSAHGLKDALDFYMPLLVTLAAVGAIVVLALRAYRDRTRPGAAEAPAPTARSESARPDAAVAAQGDRARPRAAAAIALLAAAFFVYLRSRPDAFHLQPLAASAAILLPLAIAASRAIRPLALVLLLALALLTVDFAERPASALVSPPAMSEVHVSAADGAEAPPTEARALERTVRTVDALVPPGQPTYVLPRRSDLVRIGAPVLYVLTDRDNPTPRDHGLLTGAPAQRSIVATLARVRPRAIVRWTDPISSQREPNLRGRSSGVRLLDRWVAANYRLRQRAGYYDVLVPR
jgi:hypothetical protein